MMQADVLKAYLGDGLYAEFDGYMLTLKANSEQTPSDTVYIEPSVFVALKRFINQIEEAERKEE